MNVSYRTVFGIILLAAALFLISGAADTSDGGQNDTVIERAGVFYKFHSPAEVYVCPGPYSGNVTVPPSITVGNTDCCVAGVEKGAFADCPTLVSVILPDSVTQIDEYAFSGSRMLRKIVLGPDVRTGTEKISVDSGGFSFVLTHDVLDSFSGRHITLRFGNAGIADLPEPVRDLSGWSPVFRISVEGTDTYAPIPVSITYFKGNAGGGVTNTDSEGSSIQPPSVSEGGTIRFEAAKEYFFITSDGTNHIPFSNQLSVFLFAAGTAVGGLSVALQLIKPGRKDE